MDRLQQLKQCKQEYDAIIAIKAKALSDYISGAAPKVKEFFSVYDMVRYDSRFSDLFVKSGGSTFDIDALSDDKGVIHNTLLLPYNICIISDGTVTVMGDGENADPHAFVDLGETIANISASDEKINTIKVALSEFDAYVAGLYKKLDNIIESTKNQYAAMKPYIEQNAKYDLDDNVLKKYDDSIGEGPVEPLEPVNEAETNQDTDMSENDVSAEPEYDANDLPDKLELVIPIEQIQAFKENRRQQYYEVSFSVATPWENPIRCVFMLSASACKSAGPTAVRISLNKNNHYRVYAGSGESDMMTGYKLYMYYKFCRDEMAKINKLD